MRLTVGLVVMVLAMSFSLVQPVLAQARVVADYVTRIGPDDKTNSQGEDLETVAAILRQDRANMHRFDLADGEDEADDYFTDAQTRALFERLVARGITRPDVRRAIINGNPLVRVVAYPHRIDVTLAAF